MPRREAIYTRLTKPQEKRRVGLMLHAALDCPGSATTRGAAGTRASLAHSRDGDKGWGQEGKDAKQQCRGSLAWAQPALLGGRS